MTPEELEPVLLLLGTSDDTAQKARRKALRQWWQACVEHRWLFSIAWPMCGQRGWPTRDQLLEAGFAVQAYANSVADRYLKKFPLSDCPPYAVFVAALSSAEAANVLRLSLGEFPAIQEDMS